MVDAVCPRCAHNHGDPWAWLPDADPVTLICDRCSETFTTVNDKELPMPITAYSLRNARDHELAKMKDDLSPTKLERSWIDAELARRDRADKNLEDILRRVGYRRQEGMLPADILGAFLEKVAPGAGNDACTRLRLAGDMLNAMAAISRDATMAKAIGEIIGVPLNSTAALNAAGAAGQLLLALSRLKPNAPL